MYVTSAPIQVSFVLPAKVASYSGKGLVSFAERPTKNALQLSLKLNTPISMLSVMIRFFTLIGACLFLASAHGQTSHFISSEDVTIHYRVFGEGRPVLIINGGPGFNSEGFAVLAETIADFGYQTILFDQRGTGLSTVNPVDSSTITMDLMVQDIEAIRRDMALEQWAVLGHSFGGMLANYYAVKHPGSITAMIQSASGGVDLSLIDSAQESLMAKFTEVERDSLSLWRNQMRSGSYPDARAKYNGLYAKAYTYQEEHIPVIAARLMEGDLALNRMVWANMMAMQFDTKAGLKDFCKPVLILFGKNDILPLSLAQLADSTYCESQLSLLDQCGHYGWLDQKQRYFGEIEDFLDEVYGGEVLRG